MSNTSSTISDVMAMDRIKNLILASWGILYIIFGSIGALLNMIVLTRRTRWGLSPCIPYLFASTIAAIPLMYVTILSRIGIGFQITPFYYISILCKMQIYIANVSVNCIIWFMIGSCWDRYLSSSRNALIRRMSSTRNSYRTIFMITLCISTVYAQIFYCFEGGLTTAAAPCAAKNTPCSVIDTTLNFFIQLMAPTLLIIYFLISIHFNVRQIGHQRQIQISSTSQPPDGQNNRKADRTILRIVLVQIFFLSVCSMPIFAFRLYSTLSSTMSKSSVRRAAENLIFNVALMIFYFEKILSFYIHTLTSRHFRQILWRFLNTLHHRNVIAPQP